VIEPTLAEATAQPRAAETRGSTIRITVAPSRMETAQPRNSSEAQPEIHRDAQSDSIDQASPALGRLTGDWTEVHKRRIATLLP